MSTGETELARRIARHLDRGLQEIDPHTLAQLKSARHAALERVRREPVSVLAWALGRDGGTRSRFLTPRFLLPILGMILMVSVMLHWQQQGRSENPVEIDAKLLSSEVPIDALLDQGLDRWLQR